MTSPDVVDHAPIDGFPPGVLAFTTIRSAGSFGWTSAEPVGEVQARWDRLIAALAARGISRIASAQQVHGAEIAQHGAGWRGWLRLQGVDGHVTTESGTALIITVADCTPVFISHPRGAIAALHAGWRGTAAGILPRGLDALNALGYPANECTVHLGPAICGGCYEVGPEVFEAMTGHPAPRGCLDVRRVLEEQATAIGVRALATSSACTRCQPDRWFSHRGGDAGRQVGVLALLPRQAPPDGHHRSS